MDQHDQFDIDQEEVTVAVTEFQPPPPLPQSQQQPEPQPQSQQQPEPQPQSQPQPQPQRQPSQKQSAPRPSGERRHSGNIVRLAMDGPPMAPDEDPLDYAYFTGVAPKYGSTKCLILQLRDMANPYRGMPFRIVHCPTEYKSHPEACLLNERIHAVNVYAVDPDDLPHEIADAKHLFVITFRHGVFEWRVIRAWRRKEIVNLLGMHGIPLMYSLRQRATRQTFVEAPDEEEVADSAGRPVLEPAIAPQNQNQIRRPYHYWAQHKVRQDCPDNYLRQLRRESDSRRRHWNQNQSQQAQRRRHSRASASTEASGMEEDALNEINAMLRRLESHEVARGDSLMNPATLKFLGVSRLTFVEDTGPSLWEGEVYLLLSRNNCPRPYCQRQKKVWMVIKDSYVAFLKSVVGKVIDLFLVDRHFRYELSGEPREHRSVCCFLPCCRDNVDDKKMQLKMSNNQIVAHIAVCKIYAEPMQCGLNHLAANSDYGVINTVAKNEEDAEANNNEKSDAPSLKKIKSFAPFRESTPCKWLVDGAAYFYDLAEALEQAKEEIFIADWFLSPEVLLRRPCAGYHELINILYRKAVTFVVSGYFCNRMDS